MRRPLYVAEFQFRYKNGNQEMLNRISRFLRRRAPTNAFLLAVCGALTIALIDVSFFPPYSRLVPNVDAERQSVETVQRQQKAGQPESSGQQRGDETSEYWTPFGLRLKITDSLLVLFAFTLWWATRDLVIGSDETAKRQLRAYLGVRTGKVISYDGGSTFVVEIEIVNSGQTPARRVTHSIVAELQVVHGPRLTFEIPPTQPGEWFMAPNTNFTFEQDVAIGGSSGTGTINNGQRTIFTWGRIDFVDAFDQPQHLLFRYRSGRPRRWDNGMVMTTGWGLEPCDEGNTCT